MDQLKNFSQQFQTFVRRIQRLKQTLRHESNETRPFNASPSASSRASPVLRSPSRQRSPSPSKGSRLTRSPERPTDQLLSDFDDLLLQISADLRSKEETLQTPTPSTVHLDHVPVELNFPRLLGSLRRKIDALDELIRQIQQERGSSFLRDLSNDPMLLGKRHALDCDHRSLSFVQR